MRICNWNWNHDIKNFPHTCICEKCNILGHFPLLRTTVVVVAKADVIEKHDVLTSISAA